MDSAQTFQFFVMGGLQPDAQTVHTGLPPGPQLLFRQRSRIGLQRDFHLLFRQKGKPLIQPFQNGRSLFRHEQGRCPASEKDGMHLKAFVQRRLRVNLCKKGIHITFSCRVIGRGGKEIAVQTFLNAEGDMNIDAESFFPPA